ncbi:MAG: hypothetical protein Q8L75_00485 [Acidobacteriota bacterium]|nr:hypothetical protein [Acidobacteriota bacterium]
MTKNPSDVIYRVDAEGYLTFVNEGWNAFAVLNDTPELLGPAVLGRRVADGIAGGETRLIYDRLRERALAGARIELPYRCDSPMLRRRMSLTIVAVGAELEFRSRLLDLAMRPAVRVLEPQGRLREASAGQAPRAGAMLTVCSWCNRGRIGSRWAELEEVVAELRLFDAPVPQLTHGLCHDCQLRVMTESA